ncbi:MAG: penicillin-binding protein 2 [Candidatus Omnitrophica bacterium]|nr:penicillin-binding protein 2 [Candidatus Omnitrophota bacterium]
MFKRKVFLITGLVFLVLVLRIFYLQIIHGKRFFQLSRANSIRILPLRGARGRILDRNGNILVDNSYSYELMVYPQNIENLEDFLKKLSSILGVSFLELKSRIQNKLNSFLPISLIKELDKEKAIILEELKFKFPAITIQLVPKRNYPFSRLASHILGYLSSIDWWRLKRWQDYGYSASDTVGYGGLEERYDYYLRAKDGGLQLEVDNRGRPRRILGFKPPRNGKDLYTTIDLRVQKIVEEVLDDYSGAVVIMDPYTGEIIAMASFPNFSPSELSFNQSILKKMLSDSNAPLVNRAISGLYPPGSVFKPVVATAGLCEQRMDTKTSFFCDGSLKIGNRQFSCWDKHGYQDVKEAITHSCDVFFYKLGLSLGAEKLNEYALKFGLGKVTHIDLPEEKAGLVPHPILRKLNRRIPWFDGDTANFSIGQGDLLATPLQIVRMISVFANKGNLVRPYLVKSIGERDISARQRNILPLGIEDRILNIIHNSMKKVVEDDTGTAHILYLSGVSIAGKTGTAQVNRKQSHAWFTGYFPVENPRYSICVILEYGGSSSNACWVAKRIIEKMKEESLI